MSPAVNWARAGIHALGESPIVFSMFLPLAEDVSDFELTGVPVLVAGDMSVPAVPVVGDPCGWAHAARLTSWGAVKSDGALAFDTGGLFDPAREFGDAPVLQRCPVVCFFREANEFDLDCVRTVGFDCSGGMCECPGGTVYGDMLDEIAGR